MKISLDNQIATLDMENTTDVIQIPVAEFAHNLYNNSEMRGNNRTIELFPENIRWMSEDANIFIFERPPCQINITYHEGDASVQDPNLENYLITLPWQVYLFDLTLGTFSIFFRPSEITSMDDILFPAPLPNVHNSGLACLGSAQKNELFALVRNKTNKSYIINNIVNSFWMSTFNDDISLIFKTLPIEAQKSEYIQNLTIKMEINERLGSEENTRELINASIESFPVDDTEQQRDIYIPEICTPAISFYNFLGSFSIEDITSLNWYCLNRATNKLSDVIAKDSRFTYRTPNWNGFVADLNFSQYIKNLFLAASTNPDPRFLEYDTEYEEEEEDGPEITTVWHSILDNIESIRVNYFLAIAHPTTINNDLFSELFRTEFPIFSLDSVVSTLLSR